MLAGASAVEVVSQLQKGLVPQGCGRLPRGVTSDLIRQWRIGCLQEEASSILFQEEAGGSTVLDAQSELWPFAGDPEPPLLLFCRGDQQLLSLRPRVAIVGTRRCTSVGRQVAYQLGADLAEAGVTIISGLASGIDACAHKGALAVGAAVGVAGTGLDVVYPASNKNLWAEVSDSGLLVTECCRSTGPERWRFPARNRLIAGLVDAVIVVESHSKGGALITVDEAIERGCPVMAVPGSVLSPASEGTNSLLADGCIPVRSAVDVIDYLQLSGVHSFESKNPVQVEPQGEFDGLEEMILAEVVVDSVHMDRLVAVTGREVSVVLSAVHGLAERGVVAVAGSTVCLPG